MPNQDTARRLLALGMVLALLVGAATVTRAETLGDFTYELKAPGKSRKWVFADAEGLRLPCKSTATTDMSGSIVTDDRESGDPRRIG